MNRLCEIGLPTQSPSRDGFGILRRQPARALEHRLRVHVVTLADWTAAHGYTLPEIAGHLHLHARTLRQWQHDVRQDRLRVQPLGRPLLRSARADRQQVLEVLHELGPRTSVATLCDCFPMLPRAELTDLLQRYRRVWRQRYHAHPHVLHWQVAGAVWAIDFAEAPRPIDGLYPYLLAVRDLASHQQLAWLPVRNPTALEVIRVLQSLFVIHGAPLVLKSDNGSHFGADELRLFLELWDVEQLFSPPHMPSYNGAIEAGTGSMKTRTEYHATRAGRPADWSADDPEAAVLEANATARPQGPTGPTPEQSWEKRPPLTAEQRALFRTAVDRLRPAGRAAHDLPMEGPLSTRDHRTVDRYAIRRALEEHAFLSYSRRRIPLPFPKPKTANIT